MNSDTSQRAVSRSINWQYRWAFLHRHPWGALAVAAGCMLGPIGLLQVVVGSPLIFLWGLVICAFVVFATILDEPAKMGERMGKGFASWAILSLFWASCNLIVWFIHLLF